MSEKENLFEEISVWDVSDYVSTPRDKRRDSPITQLFSKIIEQTKTITTEEELSTLIQQLSDFSLKLDPQNEQHKNFYRQMEDAIVNNAPEIGTYRGNKSALDKGFDKLPTKNKINYALLTDWVTYIDKQQLAQEDAPKKLSSKMEDAILNADRTTFYAIAPTLCNTDCGKDLRKRVNNFIVEHFNDSEKYRLLKKLDAKHHDINTLKAFGDPKVIKQVLSNDTLLRNVTEYKGALPDTLSHRYQILTEKGKFQETPTSLQLKNQLTYSDIMAGKADSLPPEKIAKLLLNEKHVESVLGKISPTKLNEVLELTFKDRTYLPQNIIDKIANKELTESKDTSKVLEMMTAVRGNYISNSSSVKDHLDNIQISKEKLTQIKESPDYAVMQSTIKEHARLIEDLNQKASQRDVFNQAEHLVEKFQSLAATINKYAVSGKDGALSAADIEKMIASAAAEKYQPLDHSKARIPLLFGKGKEKSRQECLNKAIDKMNKALQDLSKSNRSIYGGKIEATLLEYSGKILNPTTLDEVKSAYQEANKNVENAKQHLSSYENYNNVSQAKRTLEKVEQAEQNLERRASTINKEKVVRLNKARQHLKEKLGIDNTAGKSGVVKADEIAAQIISSKLENTQ